MKRRSRNEKLKGDKATFGVESEPVSSRFWRQKEVIWTRTWLELSLSQQQLFWRNAHITRRCCVREQSSGRRPPISPIKVHGFYHKKREIFSCPPRLTRQDDPQTQPTPAAPQKKKKLKIQTNLEFNFELNLRQQLYTHKIPYYKIHLYICSKTKGPYLSVDSVQSLTRC